MRKETLSVPVLGIRLVPGKTFGFVRLADRGMDAFVSPPLMREIERAEGKVPPHAIVEMAEKGRRVVRFLVEPQTKLVWEGKPDEKRMIALAPEVARRWADFRETRSGEIPSVSEYGHAEFSALWQAACSAGEAGKFLSGLEKEFLAEAKRAEVSARFEKLFADWQTALADNVRLFREKLIEAAAGGHDYRLESRGEVLHTPWWLGFASGDQQAKVLFIAKPLNDETSRLVGEALAAKKAADDVQHAKENAEEIALWQEVIARARLSGVELLPRADSQWYECLVVKLGSHTHSIAGPPCDRIRSFSAWLKQLGHRREALRASGKSCYIFDPYTEREIEEMIAAEDERVRWFELFAVAEKAGLVSHYGSYIGGSGHCEVAGTKVSSSFFRAHTSGEGLWPEEREKYQAWGVRDEVVSWERIETPACTSAELERLIGIADMDAVKRDPYRHEPITEPAKIEKVRLLAEEVRLREEAKVEELRQRGLREKEARLAAQNSAEEKRLIDIALVRKDWERMLRWVTASRGYCGLHPEAQALLEEFRAKAEKLRETARAEEAHRAEEAQKQEEATKSAFLSKNTWDKLDGLKLL